MLAATYDPSNKAADAFSQDNMSDGATNKNYTATEKTKLAGIASGATANTGTVTSVNATVPTGLSVSGSPITTSGTLAVTWSAGYQAYTSTEATKLSGIESGAQVNPGNATTGAAGLMSATDKSKLDGVASGATANTGTVTSVGLSAPTGLSVSGSPVTASGSLTLAWSAGYQGYTTTEASKLSGIAAGAQVNLAVGTASGTVAAGDDSRITGAVQKAGNQTITGGFSVTPNSLGTISSFTLNPALGNYQYGTNNGAFTLTAPASDCAVDLLVTNGASAGSITFSGFTVGSSTGDALTTTNGHKFIISIRRINSVSTYIIKALQ